MKVALRLLLFSVLLNAATGIVMHYIPQLSSNPEYLGGITYDDDELTNVAAAFDNSIVPQSPATDSASIIDNILDKLNLGIIKKVELIIKQYMYGFVDMIRQQLLSLDAFTMGIIHTIMIILYALAIISLFTGKDFGMG